MAFKQSKQVVARAQLPSATDGTDLVPVIAEYEVPTGGLAVNDVIEMHGIPFGCTPVWGHLHFSAMGASATADWGYITGTYAKNDASRTCGNEFAAAVNVSAAGVSSIAKPQFTAAQTDESTQGWGLKVTGAAWPAGGKVRAVLYVATLPVGL